MGFWLISNVNISVVDLKLYARFIIYESTKALWVGFWTYAPLLIDEKPRTIKDEVFLEFINSILLTGDIPGLFAKDEVMAITADLRNQFIKERGAQLEDTQDNLKQFFIDKFETGQ